MDDLIKSLKSSHATVFGFYLKSHFFHWNVEGKDFYQLHKMFQKIYEDVFGSVDVFAEHIRALNAYAPGSFSRLQSLSRIKDQVEIPNGDEMVEMLLADNEKVLEALNDTMRLATEHNKQGLINFVGARIEQHNKWGWFLRATKEGDKKE